MVWDGYHDGMGKANTVIGQMDSDADLEVAVATASVDTTSNLRVYSIPPLPYKTPSEIWSSINRDRYHSRHDGTLPTGTSSISGVNFNNAYIWPSPVKDDIAYIRFEAGTSGTAELAVYDLIGRRVHESSHSFNGLGDVEIPLDVTNLASGVYVARVEAAGKHTLIRFGVVK
jgi:hypothetical protein